MAAIKDIRWQEACHEAAHAVAAYLDKRPLISLTVVPDPRYGEGRCEYEGRPCKTPDGQWDREAITTDAIITLAGSLAQEQALPQALPAEVLALQREICPHMWLRRADGADDSDLAIIRRNLRGLYAGNEEEVERELDGLCTRTEELFDPSSRAWAVVETLATELCERETLTGEEATEIIQTALKEGDA